VEVVVETVCLGEGGVGECVELITTVFMQVVEDMWV